MEKIMSEEILISQNNKTQQCFVAEETTLTHIIKSDIDIKIERAFDIELDNSYNSKIERLSEKLNYVNNMDYKELDEFYDNRLLDFEIDSSKEAGLGIIDIRLKTDGKLGFSFLNIDDKYSFYTLRAKISKK